MQKEHLRAHYVHLVAIVIDTDRIFPEIAFLDCGKWAVRWDDTPMTLQFEMPLALDAVVGIPPCNVVLFQFGANDISRADRYKARATHYLRHAVPIRYMNKEIDVAHLSVAILAIDRLA